MNNHHNTKGPFAPSDTRGQQRSSPLGGSTLLLLDPPPPLQVNAHSPDAASCLKKSARALYMERVAGGGTRAHCDWSGMC